jgi:hypothetical protein
MLIEIINIIKYYFPIIIAVIMLIGIYIFMYNTTKQLTMKNENDIIDRDTSFAGRHSRTPSTPIVDKK